jgi:hypothetical protein
LLPIKRRFDQKIFSSLLDDEFIMSITIIKQTKQYLFLGKIRKITCFSLQDCWEIKWKELGKQMQPRFLL